jgi:hypothetical protein
MLMGEFEILGRFSLKFCEAALAAEKISLPFVLTSMLGIGGVYVHAAHRVQDEMIFRAGAMRTRRGGMLKFITYFITHKVSLAGIPALHKKTVKMQPTILADPSPSFMAEGKEEGKAFLHRASLTLPRY